MAEQRKWRIGARLGQHGKWIWPRGLYELDLERAMAAAIAKFPFSTVGVEPEPPSQGDRLVKEPGKAWRRETPLPEKEPAMDPARMWWNRD